MLQGKTAVVTGASRGIGRAIALAMAGAGARVVILYAGNDEAARETLAAITALGARGLALRCNVADEEAVKSAVSRVMEEFGGIDILVNNAGITRDQLLMRMSGEDFRAVVDVNLLGAFYMIKHVCPAFLKKRAGRIINITSVSGLMGNAGQANYAAAKAGMIGLTKSTARELASRGITCNAIAPGLIDTDMVRAMSEQSRAAMAQRIPLGRVGRPEDVAGLAVFLASQQAGYITGEVIRVDGGLCM